MRGSLLGIHALVVLLLVVTKDVYGELVVNSQQHQDLTAVLGVLQRALLNTMEAVSNLTQVVAKGHGLDYNECPVPFINLMNQCFYLNKVDKLDFEASRKFCQGMGADLAQPKYPHALRVYIRDTFGDTRSIFKLGGSDLVEEGDWRWLTGESITEWWSPGQPDDYRGQQDCLYVQCSPAYKQPFDDGGCQSKTPFICEYKK
ncbi:unnamed protein product [Meganyctiphanes norvegica]|uniref:C-type lectin domain-containing protein n=1 Tax=Meganyctiphanes norvegica TaxID=48144 RepID=A0AAV2SBJ9_MEGNR